MTPPESEDNENKDMEYPEFVETDEDILRGFEKVETPEYNNSEEETEKTKLNEQKGSEGKEKENSNVTKSNLDRLPETGIADNIEIIYIFEIITLGFALLLLSFRSKQRKARIKK